MLSKIACHVLSHFATQANLYWHPQRIWEFQTLGGRAKVVEVAPPPLPNGDISRNTCSNENCKKICQNHQISQADFSLTNLTKIH